MWGRKTKEEPKPEPKQQQGVKVRILTAEGRKRQEKKGLKSK